MEIDSEEITQYYASLSDSALLLIARHELTETGRQCYDAEILRRELNRGDEAPAVGEASAAREAAEPVRVWLRAYFTRFRQRYPRRVVIQRVIASVILTIGATAWGVWRHREEALNRLWAQASGIEGSDAALAAVRELATYRGEQSTTMLLAIASGRTGFLGGNGFRLEAIKALNRRRTDQISDAISSLLRPQERADVREAVADSLHDGPCSDTCVARILYYLERVWRGEPNFEDRNRYPKEFGAFGDRVKASGRRKQEAIYKKLYEDLHRRESATLRVMVEVYGIDTEAPSAFALAVLPHIRTRYGCQLLIASQNEMGEPNEFFDAPRKELADALQAMQCR